MSRKFGVEIEAIINDKDLYYKKYKYADILYPNFDQIRDIISAETNLSISNNGDYTYWQIIDDGSLEDKGLEAISPIFEDRPKAFDEIRKMTSALQKIKCNINKKCGLHIHFDAHDIKFGELLYIMYKYYIFSQSDIDFMVNKLRRGEKNDGTAANNQAFPLNEQLLACLIYPSFRHANHKKAWSKATLERRCKDIHLLSKTHELKKIQNYIYRDVTMNIENIYNTPYENEDTGKLIDKITIEFRHHHGTLDSTRIINWILFLDQFITQCIKEYNALNKFDIWIDLNRSKYFKYFKNVSAKEYLIFVEEISNSYTTSNGHFFELYKSFCRNTKKSAGYFVQYLIDSEYIELYNTAYNWNTYKWKNKKYKDMVINEFIKSSIFKSNIVFDKNDLFQGIDSNIVKYYKKIIRQNKYNYNRRKKVHHGK